MQPHACHDANDQRVLEQSTTSPERPAFNYPGRAATDPLNWGVPNLTFLWLHRPAEARGAALRTDDRTDGQLRRGCIPIEAHQLRIGGDYRLDNTDRRDQLPTRAAPSRSRGSTRLAARTAGGSQRRRLRRLPARRCRSRRRCRSAARRICTATRSMRYIEDNWQKSAKLTFNLGLRYELALPYTEINGQMANLDAAPGFTRRRPGAFAGSARLPRTAASFRRACSTPTRTTSVRASGFAYRVQAEHDPARRVQHHVQPRLVRDHRADSSWRSRRSPTPRPSRARPRRRRLTSRGLRWRRRRRDDDEQLGRGQELRARQIQTWNATVTRNLTQNWSVVARLHRHQRARTSTFCSAPNRGPAGAAHSRRPAVHLGDRRAATRS